METTDENGHLISWGAALPSAEAAPPQEPMATVLAEVARATMKFPTWPTDPLHAVAVVGEEFGELTKAALEHTYEPHKSSRDDVRKEAMQTAAMALRFVMSLDAYQFRAGPQHQQAAPLTESQHMDALDTLSAEIGADIQREKAEAAPPQEPGLLSPGYTNHDAHGYKSGVGPCVCDACRVLRAGAEAAPPQEPCRNDVHVRSLDHDDGVCECGAMRFPTQPWSKREVLRELALWEADPNNPDAALNVAAIVRAYAASLPARDRKDVKPMGRLDMLRYHRSIAVELGYVDILKYYDQAIAEAALSERTP